MREEEIQKKFTQILDQLCTLFKLSMKTNSEEKKFVWRGLHYIKHFHITGDDADHDDYLPRFILKLKEIFIGCDIIIDPLKTYVIIDWS